MKNAHVIGYLRVSTDLQSYERQLNDITARCEYSKFDLVKVFAEKESGTHDVRPELTKMLAYVKENNVKYVIITELSRLGRTKEVLNTIDTLSKLKVGLISMKENVQSLNEDGTINGAAGMFLGILSSIYTYELDTFASRTKSGKLKAVVNGNVISNKNYPYGYMKESEQFALLNANELMSPELLKLKKKMVINEDEAVTVKMIYEMSLKMGCRAIASYLNNTNVPTRQNMRWLDGVIYKILTNTIYIGQRKYLGNVYDCPQIIDNVLFNAVQANLNGKCNHQGVKSDKDYLLNDKKIVCGCCGKWFTPRLKPNAKTFDKFETVYRCGSNRGGYKIGHCGNSGVNVGKLELAVTNLIRFSYGTNLFTELMEPAEQIDKTNDLINELSEVEKLIKKLNSKKMTYVDRQVDGIITTEELKSSIEPIIKEITKLSNQIVNIKAKLKAIEKQSDIENFMNEEDITETINRDYLRTIVESVTIYPTDKHLTNKANDITVRCDVSIMNQVTQIYISNRTNQIEIKHVNGKIEKKENI